LRHGESERRPFEIFTGEEAPILAARLLTETPVGRPLPTTRMRLATTLGTNALLTRGGVAPVLFTTRGFGDLLSIGTQQRPDLFALHVEKRAQLYCKVVELDERLDASGTILRSLDCASIEPVARQLVADGVRSAAIGLMHAHRNPTHELQLAQRLSDWGFTTISCSSELSARIKLLPRTETAVVDAYLAPVVRRYLDRVQAALGQGELLIMTSAGGLLDPESYRARDSLFSGPAGGVVGAAESGRSAGHSRILGFDMGGTSTDVARFDGDYEYVYEQRIGDAHLLAPALAIETVAAGGGSVCWLDGERLRVGPQSAGARPGPACYGEGGPLTLTDVNLLLGRLDEESFGIPVVAAPARERLRELLAAIRQATGETPAESALLEGLLAIADETMADAVRGISLRRGYDPADHALVSFGGAGGQHACAVAERLGVTTIVVPLDASLLSARGLGCAVLERFAEEEVLLPLDQVAMELPGRFAALEDKSRAAVVQAGAPEQSVEIRRRTLHLRFVGQDGGVEIDWTANGSIETAFAARYVELFGHRPDRRAIELESMRVVASVPAQTVRSIRTDEAARNAAPVETRRACFDGTVQPTAVYDRGQLAANSRIGGPALLQDSTSTVVLRPGWSATIATDGSLCLSCSTDERASSDPSRPEAIRLELFTQRFYTLVREMGQRLERTAVSTNVKERLDFSCALLDASGELVVNAPHIPVHLGALGLCVRSVIAERTLRPGDVLVTNHPGHGGSHLPDVTVITPVFCTDRDAQPVGYVANRAHHAEIGGSRPGSMPPAATCLAEEGVVLPPTLVIDGGKPHWDHLRRLLGGGPYPSRNVEDNLADLRAAVAANHAGAASLRRLVAEHGREQVTHYMSELTRLAEGRMRAALRRLGDTSREAAEELDDGRLLQVRLDVRGGDIQIDFSGSAEVHPGNLNATPAIVRSAVLYVLRLLLAEPLPLNEGLMRPVTLELPRGMLNPEFGNDAHSCPAVVGGNVETSQRLVDTLIKALGLCACSQGTMNNLIFGGASFGYYETLGGGTGAGPDFDGASAVHSHMTNTRITDPEILEQRYPVRVERFAIRRGSGGSGRRSGGDGLIRELRFLEPVSLSVLTQHRKVAPYGVSGGQPGATGRQRVIRADGTILELGSIDGCEMGRDDRIVMETPGGGGWGAVE